MNAATGAYRTLSEGARKRPFVAGLLGALVAVFVLLVVLYVLPPSVNISESIVIQAIASSAVVLAATLPAILSTRKVAAAAAKDAAVVRAEVKNDHVTNFREDHDAHKDEILRAVAAVAEDLRQVRRDVREDLQEVRSDIRGIRRDGGRQDERLLRLEGALKLQNGEVYDR